MGNLPKHSSTAGTPSKVFPILENEKKLLLEEISVLNKQIEDKRILTSSLNAIGKELNDAKEELENTKKEIASFDLDESAKRIKEAKAEEQTLSDSVYQKEAKVAVLTSEIDQKETCQRVLEKSVKTLEKDEASLLESTKDKESKEKILTFLNGEIGGKQIHLETLKKDITEAESARASLLLENAKTKKETETLLFGIEAREGALNIKEVKLTKLENRLRVLKQELETYYNRKFPYIT